MASPHVLPWIGLARVSDLTASLLDARLPRDLSAIVFGYFRAPTRKSFHLGQAGEYEACQRLRAGIDLSDAANGAIRGGHTELVRYLLSRDAPCINRPLQVACEHNYVDIVHLLLERNMGNVDRGLVGACIGGHTELALLMITRGATRVDAGLYWARAHGHLGVVEAVLQATGRPSEN